MVSAFTILDIPHTNAIIFKLSTYAFHPHSGWTDPSFLANFVIILHLRLRRSRRLLLKIQCLLSPLLFGFTLWMPKAEVEKAVGLKY